ncbi:hypothetical protein BDW62DRAFT_127324 [Aspergillus aurantiobrunneus]
MSDDYGPPAGFALRRNGTCTANEELCSNPWGNWYSCCPSGTHCSDGNVCCPTTAGCANYIEQDPHCARNTTWDLYHSETSYFCCLNTSRGFLAGGLVYNGSSTTGIGCADGLPEGEDNTALIPIARGNASETTTASSSATASATSTRTPSRNSDSSSNNAGAIAGGVVGGCAGLALIIALVWFVMRRRRQKGTSQAASAPLPSTDAASPAKEYKGAFQPGELQDTSVPAELQASPNSLAHELPPDPVVHELPAQGVR